MKLLSKRYGKLHNHHVSVFFERVEKILYFFKTKGYNNILLDLTGTYNKKGFYQKDYSDLFAIRLSIKEGKKWVDLECTWNNTTEMLELFDKLEKLIKDAEDTKK